LSNSRLTFKKSGQINESPIVIISVPLLEKKGILGLKRKRFGVAVNDDDLGKVAVQTPEVLEHERDRSP